MYLVDLSVHPELRTLSKEDKREFSRLSYPVVELFRALIPGKYVLDGMRKVNIMVGVPQECAGYAQLINVSELRIPEFDFKKFFAALPLEQAEMILCLIETSLLDLAARFNADPAPLQAASREIRDRNFQWTGIIQPLSRSTPSRKTKMQVFRTLSLEGQVWGINLCNGKGTVLHTFMIPVPDFSALLNLRRSKWDGNDFVLLDTLGHEHYRLRARDYQQFLQ